MSQAVTGVRVDDLGDAVQLQGAGAALTSLPSGPETAPGTNVNIPCAWIWAELTPGVGTPLSMEKISAFDVTGSAPSGTVNTTDVSFVMAEGLKVALGAQARARDDYDYNGAMNINDVAIAMKMALDVGLGSGSRTTGQSCP